MWLAPFQAALSRRPSRVRRHGHRSETSGWRSSRSASVGLSSFKPHLPFGCGSNSKPAGLLIEAFGSSARFGCEPERSDALIPEPLDHLIVEQAAIPSALVCRVDEQCPYI